MSIRAKNSKTNPKLNKRIIIALVLFIAFVFGSFVMYQLDKREELIRSSLIGLKDQYNEFELDFRRKVLAISNFANTLHEFKTSHSCGFDFDSLSQNYLKNELSNFDFAKGMGFMFEPYEFDHTRKLYHQYVYKNEMREIISFDSLSNNTDYLRSDYYTTCLPNNWDRNIPREEKTYWSSPYYDSVATKAMLVTITSPIYNGQKKLIGVAVVNLNLKGLMELSKSKLPTKGSESFVLQLSSGKVLSNTLDSNSFLKPIHVLDWLNKDMLSIDNNEIKYETVFANSLYYRMYLVNIADNYVFGFLIPYEDYHSPLILPFIITLLAGFLIVYVVLYFVKKSFKTITDLNNQTIELNLSLENKVIERTKQYEDTTIELREEIESHKQTEAELKQTNEELSLLNETIADDSKRLLFLNEEIAVSEQKLREASNAKDKFISILAHDIKNPIHSILISSEFFVSEAANLDFEQTLNVASTIHKSVSHISNLLDDLLLWSRSQSGTMEFVSSPIMLKDLVVDTANLFKQASERKDITFSINIPQNLVLVADKNMVSTILRNLISNAIKFSHIGSIVLINAEDSKYRDYIEISVADQGVGISKENISKLFRKDVSVSTKGTMSESGTGLGLLLCKEFMDRHSGVITVESKIANGTVFTIRFPKID